VNQTSRLIPFDPLLQNVALPLSEILYPIGFPLDIRTNHQHVLAAARESWAATPRRFYTPTLRVHVAVSDEGPGNVPPIPFYRAQRHLLTIISDAANYAVCDFAASFAFCWLTPAAAAAADWVRHFFLDGIVYTTLMHLYVTAVHAACIAKNGRGVLLCAPSGIGKSVLALACARGGWTFVTDDVTYVLRDNETGTVMGKPEQMKFLPSAAELFPDLRAGKFRADQNGHPFVELRTRDLNIPTAHDCVVDAIVFLQRSGNGTPHYRPVDSNDAFARLFTELPVFEMPVRESHLASLRMLSRLRTLEMQYDKLIDGVRMLDEVAGAQQ
jgi:hypothetical protein